jgi:hypothetical protein
VTFDFLHNVFLLHFAFEATQRAFQSFAVLQMYFCQLIHHLPVRIVPGRPPEAVSETQLVYCSVFRLLERRFYGRTAPTCWIKGRSDPFWTRCIGYAPGVHGGSGVPL